MTRLRNRPRLQVSNGAKTTAAPAANGNGRRHLVSSLLPKRRLPGSDAKESATTEGSMDISIKERISTFKNIFKTPIHN